MAYLLGCAQQTPSKTNRVAHQSHTCFFVSEIVEKLSVQPKFGAENVVKTETQQTFVNELLGFITLGIYTPLEAHYVSVLTIIA